MLNKVVDNLIFLFIAAILAFAFLAGVSWADKAKAKGNFPPGPISDWFKAQHNSNGQWCCDRSDGHLYYGDYTENADGSVDVNDNGKKYHITKDRVLTGPNPTGTAVWWYIQYTPQGDKFTYCFAVGTLS